MPEGESCANCRFRFVRNLVEPIWQCRRRPPKSRWSDCWGVWPEVSDSGWCGEWKHVDSRESLVEGVDQLIEQVFALKVPDEAAVSDAWRQDRLRTMIRLYLSGRK